MENMTKLSKRKGVSPVIATVILVAVTITVAVAVAYWMSGIASQYTSFEKVEIQTAISTIEDGGAFNYWKIVISLKNSGTKTATLTDVFINDALAGQTILVPTVSTDITAVLDPGDNAAPLLIESGATLPVTIYIGDTYGFLSSGTTINIRVHSAAGMDYIKLVQLT